jgi:hypothetical protein
MQSGKFYELSVVSTGDKDLGTCREYTKLFSHFDNGWHEITSSSISFALQKDELVNKFGGQVIDKYRVDLLINCDYPDWLDSMEVSGTYKSHLYDGSPATTHFSLIKELEPSGTPISTNIQSGEVQSLPSAFVLTPNKTIKLQDNKDSLLDYIVIDAKEMEKNLTTRTSDNTALFSILTQTNLHFTGKVAGSYYLIDYYIPFGAHQALADQVATIVSNRVIVDSTTPPQPIISNSKNEPLQITSVYQTLNPSVQLTTLDTTKNSGRQITVEVVMKKWLDGEGVPIINIVKPNGESYLKVNTAFSGQSGDDRTFLTRVTIPLNSDYGTWKIIASNVNRVMDSTRTFDVLNTVKTPEPEPCELTQTCPPTPPPTCKDTNTCPPEEKIDYGFLNWKLFVQCLDFKDVKTTADIQNNLSCLDDSKLFPIWGIIIVLVVIGIIQAMRGNTQKVKFTPS